jgi:hypothetical protein
LGEALKKKVLDPDSAAGRPFVDWFIALFDLERLTATAG